MEETRKVSASFNPSSRLGTLLPNPARAKEERRTRLLAPKARRPESVAPVQDEKASRHTSAPSGHALSPPPSDDYFFRGYLSPWTRKQQYTRVLDSLIFLTPQSPNRIFSEHEAT